MIILLMMWVFICCFNIILLSADLITNAHSMYWLMTILAYSCISAGQTHVNLLTEHLSALFKGTNFWGSLLACQNLSSLHNNWATFFSLGTDNNLWHLRYWIVFWCSELNICLYYPDVSTGWTNIAFQISIVFISQ